MQPQASNTSPPPAEPLRETNDPLKTAVILLNWRRPDLILACLASLTALEGNPPDIYVVEIHLGDDSFSRICEGLKLLAAKEPLRFRYVPQVVDDSEEAQDPLDPRATLALIESPQNLGFGGGVNLGLRASLLDPSIQLFCILNKDTEITPPALDALKSVFKRDASLGVLGSCLCYHNHPEMIQGGWTLQALAWDHSTVLGGAAISRGSWRYRSSFHRLCRGAAVCIRREALIAAGLFPENYFLYFEDMDWAFSVRKKAPRWRVDDCLESVVLHQEGARTSANESEGRRQPSWRTITSSATDFALRGAGFRAVNLGSTSPSSWCS